MRSILILIPGLLVAAACDGTPVAVAVDGSIDAQPIADAPPPDAPWPPTLGPSLVFDDLHIAGLFEDAHAFSLLGQVINPQLQERIDSGMLLMGVELRGFEDVTSPNDPDMTVGMYYLQDPDADPSDNFDPDQPELFALSPGSIVMDEPAVHFTTAAVQNARLHAEGVSSLDVLGELFPVPISNLELDGRLAIGDSSVRTLEDGRLRGVIGMSLLSLTPSPLGEMCAGESMLDVLALGCGLFPIQPDSDVDGDGLETVFDTDGDNVVDRCVDGDGSEILGVECPRDPAMADGYQLIFVVHGVRAFIIE